MNVFFKKCICIFILCITSTIVHAERIRDLTTVQGLQENKLIGYGLIVGLDGTGDETRQSPMTGQTTMNMLYKLGITTTPDINIRLKNVAAVMVTATLPPFHHIGQKIDVMVSSIGNAKSLNGGTLLMTPLKGHDNKIYAIAQGNILIKDSINTSQLFINNLRNPQHVNGGIVHEGASINVESQNSFGKDGIINLQLNEENFNLIQIISDNINIQYPDTAIPLDARTIQLSTPDDRTTQIRMLSNIQNIEINIPIQDARVIINAKTGSIVINHDVKLGNCAISQGKLSVVIERNKTLPTNNNQQNNSNSINTNISSSNTENQRDISDNHNLNNIMHALTSLGVKPSELILILQSMKNAGCLRAKLEIT
ncbi:MAG: flagellar basal body P-ring protein FlgI [Buchnera aphidicola (Eriosoma harunire)]